MYGICQEAAAGAQASRPPLQIKRRCMRQAQSTTTDFSSQTHPLYFNPSTAQGTDKVDCVLGDYARNQTLHL